MGMLNFKLLAGLILFSIPFSLSEGFLESYLTPQGCVACIKAADKHFLKGVISQKPDCVEAKEKYKEFKALGSTSYMFHICKENNNEEFQSRLKTMRAKVKEVFHSFEKCIRVKGKELDFGQKSAIKESWKKFEEERKKCDDTEHLNEEIQRFWNKLPFTGPMEVIWDVDVEKVKFISNLVV